jgi:alanine dehydrogenase
MRIGIPKEIKVLEGRVGLVPEACAQLIKAGHEVLVEQGAGLLSGYRDEDYRVAGARVVEDAAALYGGAELIVKVKEPVEGDLALLRADHRLFCYLHLAALPDLARRLCDLGLTAVAFETVEDEDGNLPLLAPMSDIAGRVAVQIATHLLHRPQGGRGILLGGVPTTERGRVVVLGAGVAGAAAALTAARIGAEVTVFDLERDRLAAMRELGDNVNGLYAFTHAIEGAVAEADLVVGAVLIPGRRAPVLVRRSMVAAMRPDTVIADISVDQGGCIETTRPTTYDAPVYREEGVQHLCVTNLPGGVPRTASQALSAAVIPYVLALAESDWRRNPALAKGVNVSEGKIVYPGLEQDIMQK